MTDKLPPNLLALFAPRPPLRYLEAPDYAPERRRTQPVSGVAAFLPALQVYKETDVYHPTESWLEMKDRKKREQKEAVEKLLASDCEDTPFARTATVSILGPVARRAALLTS
jgi:U1 small nuclear ribonucleoprotein